LGRGAVITAADALQERAEIIRPLPLAPKGERDDPAEGVDSVMTEWWVARSSRSGRARISRYAPGYARGEHSRHLWHI
jgi:hypothetical protein